MKVLMITHGSRGDVQPFAALAKALTEAGHTITMAAPAELASLAKPFCAELIEIHDGPNTLATDNDVVKGLETNFRGLYGKLSLLQTMQKTRRLFREYHDDLAAIAHDMKETGERFDILLYHVSVPGHHIADFLGLPSVVMCPQAYWVPTGSFPDPSFPLRLPRLLNRASYVASRTVLWAFAGPRLGWPKNRLGVRLRRGGKLRQLDGSPSTVLHAFSPRLLPPSARYPPWVHTTGFWSLPNPDQWAPPEQLSAFLEVGPPPIYLGFASSVHSDPKHLGRIVADAVRAAKVRAIVVGGWSGMTIDDLGQDITFVDDIPFDWLFPRVAAVVHHGGLGTTGAALVSGRPQVVYPSFPDQWFNARRMHTLGVAPPPLPRRELTAASLARGVRRAVGDPMLAARAKELSEEIRAEGGVTAAVGVLESLVAKDQAAGL